MVLSSRSFQCLPNHDGSYKKTQSSSASSVLETLSANVLHDRCDASRCASNIIIAHTSGGTALDFVQSLVCRPGDEDPIQLKQNLGLV